MKVLLIDNYSKHTSKLEDLISSHYSVDLIELEIFEKEHATKYDLVVLSGSSKYSVLKNQTGAYAKEIEFINTTHIPIIGVCIGFELIAHAFESELVEVKKLKGLMEISTDPNEEIFEGIERFEAYESHRWIVEKVGPKLKPIAESEYGIEAIKHKTLPVYGFQFHPEMMTEELISDEIFLRTANLLIS